ncbi:hypothetical protein IG631_20338 [Alternaria alternata]|nr:hypothetical protein IG631_20338 [Alternaria alternata]
MSPQPWTRRSSLSCSSRRHDGSRLHLSVRLRVSSWGDKGDVGYNGALAAATQRPPYPVYSMTSSKPSAYL